MNEPDERKCLNAAFRLLGLRDHSSHELGRKLSLRGFDFSHIAAAIAECERLHYLDDRKFCERVVQHQRRKGYGIYKILQILEKKGLSPALSDACLERCKINQATDCRRVLAKKLKSNTPGERQATKEKLYRFLKSRGFASAIVLKVLAEEMNDDFSFSSV
jgi:regulatory protein